MNFNELKELIELINDSELSYFEIKYDQRFIKMDKSINRNHSFNNNDSLDSKSLSKLEKNELNDDIKAKEESTVEDKLNLSNNISIDNKDNDRDFEYIKSPIVGTFYKAVSPDADAFVSVGQRISKGDVICIVEAMKLMNEITAEYDCEIISVLGENGKMVQYGDSLFKVRRI